MNQPPLNPDALEAAAKELFLEDENTTYVKYPEWDSPENVGKPVYIENARAAVSAYLAAALPEVTSAKASAWEEGFQAGWEEHEDPGAFVNDYWDAKTPNPYLPEES